MKNGATFRSIKLSSGAEPAMATGEAAVSAPGGGQTVWIDLENPAEADLALLQERFGFHPLAIEDCLQRSQRAKIDDYNQYWFAVLYEIRLGAGTATQFEELSLFTASNFLITIHRKPIGAIEGVWKRVAADSRRGDYGVDHVLYLLFDALVDGSFEVIDQLSDALSKVEAQILGARDGSELGKLLKLKRSMVAVRRVLAGERDVVTFLLRRTQGPVSEKAAPFFRDVYDHLIRAYEQIDVERDLLGNAMDAYMSTVSNSLNVVMKQLTILSAIFLPSTFITSFFGQNFSALPFDSRTLFYGESAACILVPLAMFYWFYKWRWL